jgi:hypothetical protein
LPRNVYTARVADRHGLDPPTTVDEHPDAAAQRVTRVGELFGQFVGDDVVGRYASAVETLDAVFVGLREA